MLDSKRPTQSYLETIYLVQPSPHNIDVINSDFVQIPPKYAAAHVFFTPGLSDTLALRMQTAALHRFLRHLEVTYIDFYPLESLVFSLDEPRSLETFYSPYCHNQVTGAIKRISSQLVSLCASTGEYPTIRFYKPTDPLYEAHVLPYMLATAFQQELDSYARSHPEFPASEGRPRSQFLILDRSVDVIAPLLHEFTYQAMAYDLLDIKDRTLEYEEDSSTSKGVLADSDPEWVSLRHLHMQEAIDSLTAKLDKFKRENPHLADPNQSATVSDLQDMLAGLPMFAETKQRFSLHLHMANECMNLFQARNLSDVADVEQTCATGLAADNKRPRGLADDLVRILGHENLTTDDKQRLIAIYALHRAGLVDSDLSKLRQHSDLNETDLTAIRNILLLGGQVLKSAPKAKTPAIKRFHSAATSVVYDTSRYIPGIKNITDNLINGTLDPHTFPFTKDEPLEADANAASTVSLRNPRQRAAWARTNSFQAAKQRIFVFVAGGFTQSEARSVYELSSLYSKEVIIGGNDIVTPRGFLTSLSKLNDAAAIEADRRYVEAKRIEAEKVQIPPTRSANIVPNAQASQKPLPVSNPPVPISKKPLPLEKSANLDDKKSKKKGLGKYFK